MYANELVRDAFRFSTGSFVALLGSRLTFGYPWKLNWAPLCSKTLSFHRQKLGGGVGWGWGGVLRNRTTVLLGYCKLK